MDDLKCVYKAATLNAAESVLDELENKWGEKYPMVIKSRRGKWPTLPAYFKYRNMSALRSIPQMR
ncbi:hypothetical protein GL2_24700 [Microbulbifer sp. GL-2]|nr:hypothetical protein GL2_24700 [Microbulbifer sp. GL-2]